MSEFQGHLLPGNLGVTGTGGGGGIDSVTASLPLASTGGPDPNISLNGTYPANSSGQIWNIPVTGVDASLHKYEWDIDSNAFFRISAAGDGAGSVDLTTAKIYALRDFSVQAPTGTTNKFIIGNDDFNSGVTDLSMFGIPLTAYGVDFMNSQTFAGRSVLGIASGDSPALAFVGISNSTTITDCVVSFDINKGDGAGGIASLSATEPAMKLNGLTIFGTGNLLDLGAVAFGSDSHLGVSGSYNKYFDFEQTTTDFSSAANWNMLRGVWTVNPSGNLPTTSLYGLDFTIHVPQSNTHNFSLIDGLYFSAIHDGTGLIDTLYGVLGGCEIDHNGSATTAIGMTAFAELSGATSTIGLNIALSATTACLTAGPVITNNHGIHIYKANTLDANGILTNVGLFIEDQNVGITSQRSIKTGLGKVEFGDGLIMNSISAPASTPADTFTMYSADITAGNAVPNFRTEAGNIIKLFTSSAYSIVNVTTDRSYDANSTTLDEIADTLGTLVADLKLTGLIG